eukprot:CAMPEP_0175152350 /NCGR_PEP_ID=MMETSP0087-20121206/19055_1 /TAXON_ID=136419 /ORGANISM="Unknown Unknown, Strain D1" /LENGTH=110 /DNA_ID=CAMNT_0016438753 /DNA_START=762 /DNA_END=1094 /DNA_ORIENTATION=-
MDKSEERAPCCCSYLWWLASQVVGHSTSTAQNRQHPQIEHVRHHDADQPGNRTDVHEDDSFIFHHVLHHLLEKSDNAFPQARIQSTLHTVPTVPAPPLLLPLAPLLPLLP